MSFKKDLRFAITVTAIALLAVVGFTVFGPPVRPWGMYLDAQTTYRILVKQGLRANLPTLATGEFGFSTDTKELHIGSAVGNLRVMGDYITPEMYGAKGDGVTDDTTAIQAALDALDVAGGGTLRLAAKSYLIGGSGAQVLLVDDKINIIGISETLSILKVTAATGAATDIIRVDYAGVWRGAMFSDFSIDKVSGTPGRHGIYIDLDTAGQQFAYCNIQDIYIDQLGGNCIYVNSTATDRFYNNHIYRNILIGGIHIIGGGDSVTVEGNLCGGVDYGIFYDSVSGAGSLNIIGNTFIGVNGGVYVDDSQTVLIQDNFFEQPGTNNPTSEDSLVVLKGTTEEIAHAHILGNRLNITPVNVHYGMYIDHCANALIHGNIIALGDANSDIANITANSDYCLFTNNYYPALSDPATRIDDAGIDTNIYEGPPGTFSELNVEKDAGVLPTVKTHGTQYQFPNLRLRKGAGTIASPTDVSGGHYLGLFSAQGYKDGGWRDAGYMLFTAGAVGTNIVAANWLLQLTDPAGVDTARLMVDDNGNFGISQTSWGTSATKTLAQSTGNYPTTSPADAYQQYSADAGGVAGQAGPHFRTEGGGIFAMRSDTGTTLQYVYQKDDLADDGMVTLPDATSGMVLVSCNAEAGMWLVQADGTVTKISGSTNTAAADTDANLCVYDSGTGATVKNRLGATGEIRIVYYYN